MSDKKEEKPVSIKGKAWAKKTKSQAYYDNIDRILAAKDKAPGDESPEAK